MIRKQLLDGVCKLTDAVKVTLGPRGRSILLQTEQNTILITSDGSAAAKGLELAGQFQNTGVRLLKESAVKTKETVGDGATTAMLLTQAMMQKGIQNIAAGANPVLIKKGLLSACALAADTLKTMALPADNHKTLAEVAGIAARDEQTGRLVAQALGKVGKEGIITIEESAQTETTLEIKEGIFIDRGYLSPYMATDEMKKSAVLENPYILITDEILSNIQDIIPILEQVAEKGGSLLIIAEKVENDVMNLIMKNIQKGGIDIVAIHPPAYGEGRLACMEDLALQTGGTLISKSMGHTLRQATLSQLGAAQSVRIDRKQTVICGGCGDKAKIHEKIQGLRTMIARTDYEFNKNKLKERLARFVSGIAVIRTGACTEIEMRNKKLGLEAGLAAAKAAMEEGIVPGGGTAFIKIIPTIRAFAESLEYDLKTGAEIIAYALELPLRQIVSNAGLNENTIIDQVKHTPVEIGLNVETETCTDLFRAGIVDPVKVLCTALQCASSAASEFLTTEAGVYGGKTTDE